MRWYLITVDCVLWMMMDLQLYLSSKTVLLNWSYLTQQFTSDLVD